MNQIELGQMVVANLDTVKIAVGRTLSGANLAPDVVADIVADTVTALLSGRGDAFDPCRGSAATFCGVVARSIAIDRLRAMQVGGQYSGAYCGFGNAQLDADRGDNGPLTHAPDSTVDTTGRAVRVKGRSLFADDSSFVAELERSQWVTEARAAVATVLVQLTCTERTLWAEMSSGTFNAANWAERHGMATATAHVHANRLRAKVRQLVRRKKAA